MRLFVALEINDSVRAGIAAFLDDMRRFAPQARWVRPESLHVTLKFIGERPEEDVGEIERALETIVPGTIELSFRGYGFFPAAEAPRVFWVGVEAGSNLTALATAVEERLASLHLTKQEHVFSPHLTLARGAGRSGSPRRQESDGPHRGFQRLQEKLAALPTPEFGRMSSREFFLFRSQLSPAGSKYTKLAGFGLR
jgi:2'-5' RNA ligase